MILKLKGYTPEGVSDLSLEINGDEHVPSVLIKHLGMNHCERILETIPGVERMSFELDNKEYSIEPNKEWEVKEL